MKIFLTGATGFIGKHLVAKLIEENNNITINLLDDENSPFDDNVNVYRLDESNILHDIKYFKEEGFDGIIHLASLYLKDHNPTDIINLINSNVQFGAYILEIATYTKVRWFINTGTFWQHYKNADYSPVNLYAATKQAFESIAKYYIETEGIKFCTLKLSDTYGPNDTRSKVFNLWVKYAKTGNKLRMSPGEQLIDISYVDDIVNAFLILADELQNNDINILNGSIYAVNAEKRYTLKEMAAIFEKVTSMKINIEWGDLPYKEREVMNPWLNGKPVPNWKQLVSLEEGIRRVYLCNIGGVSNK